MGKEDLIQGHTNFGIYYRFDQDDQGPSNKILAFYTSQEITENSEWLFDNGSTILVIIDQNNLLNKA